MKLDEAISSVRWSEVHVASGKADHVPDALIGLMSPDEETRNRSYWRLDNEVVLQSDLYEAAYYVIPILIEMLKVKAVDKSRVYDLLYEIGNGCAPTTTLCRTREGFVMPLRFACYLELAKGSSVFARDTTDRDRSVAAKATELIGLLENWHNSVSMQVAQSG